MKYKTQIHLFFSIDNLEERIIYKVIDIKEGNIKLRYSLIGKKSRLHFYTCVLFLYTHLLNK